MLIRLKKLSQVFLFLLFIVTKGNAQNHFSIATDMSLLHSLSKNQRFTAFGQTVTGNYHISQRQALFASLSYYTYGRYKNTLVATAIDNQTTPQTISYTASSRFRYRHISLGLRHYLIGDYNQENRWNLYGLAGFGLVAARVENTHSISIDTATYNVPQKAIAGTSNFIRLTVDLGLGAEIPLGTAIFLYAEAKTWLPASSNPSPYLYSNNAPQVILLNGGIRILFD